jgi:alkylation response protein AidB-like acyl-CoA dehydrogenase/flavin-dependent dehydrogenase/electron transfer flavoprotein alpha subunit/ferredoxin-like protein FixX
MSSSNFDVVVVGAGSAGLTAAIGLARAGFAVAVVEAAIFPGAENWSGCVYFGENLAHPDILGPDGLEELAWERRLVERGFFATDGHSILGMTYRDPAAFKHCYTVLRPIYDDHLGHVARRNGVAILTETTAESLIREGGRVIGVCTPRGPLYADLVFLAEGDASHLVTREGYERFSDPREAPKFLQGIKQVIEMPPGAIEEIFRVGSEEGVAYEMLLRNGTLRGKRVHLNLGGFVYANRQSLSVGLVLPADNLHEGFDGDPNLLIEWFESLPAIQPWLRGGRRGVFGAKIIRGGGARDIPTLVDEGLAIGGAASAIGIDFPYPNFTGPATAMGLLLVQAARRIRSEGGGFSREQLHRHYLQPLQQTHYWQDVEFLRRWPGYVKRTRVFFDRNLDLALGTAYIWTRPDRWLPTKWMNWLRLMLQLGGPQHWNELRQDLRHLIRALRLGEVTDRPALGRFLLDGTINALRDVCRRPRANVPEAGTLRVHYSVAGGTVATGLPPAPVQRWFRRARPILEAAARRVYSNDAAPLQDKLPSTARLLMRQVNTLDLLMAGMVVMAIGVFGALLTGWDRFWDWIFPARADRPPRGLYRRYAHSARTAGDLTPLAAPAAQQWEARLAELSYQTVATSHIHLLWPKSLPDKNNVVKDGLWHVCPAHVYEARVNSQGQPQLIVNFENCIKCETCWRTSDGVDWARDGKQRFVYSVHSPVATRVLRAQAMDHGRSTQSLVRDRWQALVNSEATQSQPSADNHASDLVTELDPLIERLDAKIIEFDDALGEEPRRIDRARAEHLEMLARYAQQLAQRIVEVLQSRTWIDGNDPKAAAVYARLEALALAAQAKAHERARRTWAQRYAWAAADGSQLRWHHLAGIRQFSSALNHSPPSPGHPTDSLAPWNRSEQDAPAVMPELQKWLTRLDEAIPQGSWRELENQSPLNSKQDAVLRDLIAAIPQVNVSSLAATLHSPLRKALLSELGRRDPSLAFRVASHLWARDLAMVALGSSAYASEARSIAEGGGLACLAVFEEIRMAAEGLAGEAWFVPAGNAQKIVILIGDQLAILEPGAPGLQIEPIDTLGLRGAGLARLRIESADLGSVHATVDRDRMRRVWHILSSADLTSIAAGMADQLCRRAVDHATSRVQFPGLFHDQESRDAIGKFGAVKKMIAEMGARRYLIETLDHTLSPSDFSSASLNRALLIKALVSEALGTAPGSLSYNAVQVFGGTGYSEDDILSKFYRDAAAWRFLGAANVDIYRRYGQGLLHGGQVDSQKLALVPGEAELFEDVAQRKALQAELDEIRNARSRLKALALEWQSALLQPLDASRERPSRPGAVSRNNEHSRANRISPAAAGEIAEALARQEAHLLASKALVLRTHARLEQGLPAETEIALVRVWLNFGSASIEEFESILRRYLDPATRRDDHPVVELAAGPPITAYADYLAANVRYDSGEFLLSPVDLLQPRLVPEMIQADASLFAVQKEWRALLQKQFGQPRDGLIYERYIERQHRPDAADLDFCRQHGFFRMPIPKELGGEERRKIDYYLLTTDAKRMADVGISLMIQVNSSLGTTPVLLARNKDLPQAQQQVAAFAADGALHREVARELETLATTASPTDLGRLTKAIDRLNPRLEKAVLNRAPLRALAHPFVGAWQEALQAARQFKAATVCADLKIAAVTWQDAVRYADEYHDELRRRGRACDLFLRWVASGQISAFALTEPSAGSDTARVATRARVCSVPVEDLGKGLYRFVPKNGKGPRFLLDAALLEFPSGVASYRWSPDADAAPIRFDEYDYETDDRSRTRYFERVGERIHFTDIAQLREREGRLWYDYWELTGSKMWITNGRMCGIMCLYAKTQEGVTGFIVDRHAEGHVVGKDEAKMGQLGSPTNELSLQAVRVPRENVIGIEGRGQVNALETLNAGRGGISTSAMADMDGLITNARLYARHSFGTIPGWVQWRLDRMEENRFSIEALAYEVVGRFEHPGTKSLRLDSAMAKMLASELLHQIIEWAEEIYGIVGQTKLHLVEKRKRDARILNIYEGTNEIQRFFILRDLASEIAPRWSENKAPPVHSGREALELEATKEALRTRVRAAVDLFGQNLWQDPDLQANCFLLAEAAAWYKAADSTLGRLSWLTRQELASVGQDPAADSGADGSPRPSVDAGSATGVMETGRRAFARCNAEIRTRLRRFDEELTHLRRGYYAPEVRAAGLMFDRVSDRLQLSPPPSRVDRALRVLVVVESLEPLAPQPLVEGDRMLEPELAISKADRSALEAALRLRDQATESVYIEVATVGSRRTAGTLREAIDLGVDRVRHIVCETEAVSADEAADALATVLTKGPAFDLILGGAGDGADEQGLITQLLTETLGMHYAGVGTRMLIQADAADSALFVGDDQGFESKGVPLPAGVGIRSAGALRPFSVAGFLAGLGRQVEILPWPRSVKLRPAEFQESSRPAPTPGATTSEVSLSPEEAAFRALAELGLTQGEAGASPYEGSIAEPTQPDLMNPAERARSVIAVVSADDAGRLQSSARPTIRAASLLAGRLQRHVTALLVAPDHDLSQRRALGQLLEFFHGEITILPVPGDGKPVKTASRLLRQSWPTEANQGGIIVGESWTEALFIGLARGRGIGGEVMLRVRHVGLSEQGVTVETARAGGKLRVRQALNSDLERAWISLSDGVEVAAGARIQATERPAKVQRWILGLNRIYGSADMQELLAETKRQASVIRLSDAEYIVDVGFGIGNRDGYENVIEPLLETLRSLGAASVVVGGSRKVTEELHLLPLDRQIGQSGVSVNPKVLIAIGVSGAPQHLNYIGSRAVILAFNRDPEAPIMTLNRQRARPRVLPVVGDLFESVPAFTRALTQENSAQAFESTDVHPAEVGSR